MADYFYDGQRDYIQRLNQMYGAFAAGPYNALPLTGGTLTGPVTGPQFRGLLTGERQAEGGFVVGGDQGGWWRIARANTSATASTQVLRILGTTPFIQFVGGNTMDTVISLRCDSDGIIRGHFYSIGGPANTAPPAVSVGLDGYIYIQLYALSTVEIYTDSTMSLPAQVTYVPGGPPADAIALPAMFGVKCGAQASLTVTNSLVTAPGDVNIGRYLHAGPAPLVSRHGVYRDDGMSSEILWVGRKGVSSPCVAMNASDGLGGWSGAGGVLYVGKNSSTNRSGNFSGTINASGADYAEYMVKRSGCGVVLPGQIVGIDSDGRLTDKWASAITFMVKSTDPCMVGGDRWGQHLGPRPDAPVRVPPTVEQVLVTPAVTADDASGSEAIPAVHNSITTAPGDTEDEWAAKQAAHEAAVIEFDIALEAARQSVDRIAFAGQVPVNVQGAIPGQYILPIQDGEGIAGLAMNPQDMTPMQMLSVVGKVIALEEDGRARIIVKVA